MSLRNNLLRYFFKIEIDLKQSLKLNDNKKISLMQGTI